MKVLIIGAGIGGLAAARALTADGHEVIVFEQAAGLRHGGAAVTLWSNGTGILGELGVALNGTGAPIDTLETRDPHGKLLTSFDIAQTAAHYGHPNICLPRTRLLGHLAEGLPGGMLAFGHVCTGAEQDGAVVRDQVWGGDPAQLTGWATWQGITPIPTPITSSRRSVLFLGRAGSCGLMPAGEGLLQWWFDQR